MAESRDSWARFKDAAAGVASLMTGFAAIAVPIVAIYISNDFAASMKRVDQESTAVGIAIAVLRDDPSEHPDNPALREWAIDVVDRFSEVPLSGAAREELKTIELHY